MGANLETRYFVALGAAFARGRFPELAGADDHSAFAGARARGLRMHKFKRTSELPRVRRVLSMLACLEPTSLLDVGSGRGVFLWPLLDAFPTLAVTSIDIDEERATALAHVRRGGLSRLSARRMDATALDFAPRSFDGVTLLEVLEHMPRPDLAAREALRVAQRFVIASVPSQPDDNPEHIRLFTPDSLRQLLRDAGAECVDIEFVRNHMVALARRPAL
jgi:ubiquinone/menaquinone biosynthesis C-methylase UbiE